MNKHIIYLTKSYELENTAEKSECCLNTFFLNPNGPLLSLDWVKNNIEQNSGSFLILDHNNKIKNMCEPMLVKRNYFIDYVNLNSEENNIRLNPFTYIEDPSELHYIFWNILNVMWDSSDPDLPIMANLIDCFTNLLFSLIPDPEKRNMKSLTQMVKRSITTEYEINGEKMTMFQGMLTRNPDEKWLPKIYYNQFVQLAHGREEEIQKKVCDFFDMFTPTMIEMMRKTEESYIPSFGFKSAYFINSEHEDDHAAKIAFILTMHTIMKSSDVPSLMVIVDDIKDFSDIIDLPLWSKKSVKNDVTMLYLCDNIGYFKTNKELEKYFKSLQESISASVLVHRNTKVEPWYGEVPTDADSVMKYRNEEFIAHVLIPSQKINEEDEVL